MHIHESDGTGSLVTDYLRAKALDAPCVWPDRVYPPLPDVVLIVTTDEAVAMRAAMGVYASRMLREAEVMHQRSARLVTGVLNRRWNSESLAGRVVIYVTGEEFGHVRKAVGSLTEVVQKMDRAREIATAQGVGVAS